VAGLSDRPHTDTWFVNCTAIIKYLWRCTVLLDFAGVSAWQISVLEEVLQPSTEPGLDADVVYLEAKDDAVGKRGEKSETERINCEGYWKAKQIAESTYSLKKCR